MPHRYYKIKPAGKAILSALASAKKIGLPELLFEPTNDGGRLHWGDMFSRAASFVDLTILSLHTPRVVRFDSAAGRVSIAEAGEVAVLREFGLADRRDVQLLIGAYAATGGQVGPFSVTIAAQNIGMDPSIAPGLIHALASSRRVSGTQLNTMWTLEVLGKVEVDEEHQEPESPNMQPLQVTGNNNTIVHTLGDGNRVTVTAGTPADDVLKIVDAIRLSLSNLPADVRDDASSALDDLAAEAAAAEPNRSRVKRAAAALVGMFKGVREAATTVTAVAAAAHSLGVSQADIDHLARAMNIGG